MLISSRYTPLAAPPGNAQKQHKKHGFFHIRAPLTERPVCSAFVCKSLVSAFADMSGGYDILHNALSFR
jgi:hypothetical protein